MFSPPVKGRGLRPLHTINAFVNDSVDLDLGIFDSKREFIDQFVKIQVITIREQALIQLIQPSPRFAEVIEMSCSSLLISLLVMFSPP